MVFVITVPSDIVFTVAIPVKLQLFLHQGQRLVLAPTQPLAITITNWCIFLIALVAYCEFFSLLQHETIQELSGINKELMYIGN